MKNQTKSFLPGLHFDGCFCCLFVCFWLKFGQVLGTVLTRLFSVSKSEKPEIAKDRFQPVGTKM